MWKSPTIEPRHCGEVPSKSTWNLVPGLGHRRHDRDGLVGDPVVVDMVRERPGAVGKLRNRPARETLRVVEEAGDELVVLACPGPFDERQQLALPDPRRGHLGEKVAQDGLGRAYRLLEEAVNGLVGLSPFVQLRGRNAQPLLVDLRIGETLTSGNASTDVRVVADGADIREHGPVVEHRPEQVDVGKVLGPLIRVVGDEDVAGTDLVSEIAEAAGKRGRHAAKMDRVAHALADEIAFGGEHGGREIPAESHDGRARGLIERDRHGVGNPFERVPDDLQAGRVEFSRHRPLSTSSSSTRRAEMTCAHHRRVRSSGPRTGGPAPGRG